MKYIFAIVFILLFSGCEVFVFGTKRTYEPEPTRETSVGTVYLFKAELDSINARAAAGLLVRPTGDPILALERYEMEDDIARMGRILYGMPITRVKTDTLTANSHRLLCEFNYMKNISFSAIRIRNKWFITDVQGLREEQ
ncbi:MAG: hypothetical protein ACK5C0_07660 [Candidatus Kapaibacterium sp.]|jgi:hypothetical protein